MKKPRLLSLRPCQFVLGQKEVEAKIAKMSSLSSKELNQYCNEHVIPVVVGPRNELYIIDHHHFARACWELGSDHYEVEVLKNLSRLSGTEFWNEMIRRHWVYLFDQFGMGPHAPSALPSDIRCLADDPYRSLVWRLIDAGLIKKQKVPFFEFQWAAFFRMNLDVRLHSKSNFKAAIKLASKLAKSKGADHLPGFVAKF
jgi:hypothetical protein